MILFRKKVNYVPTTGERLDAAQGLVNDALGAFRTAYDQVVLAKSAIMDVISEEEAQVAYLNAQIDVARARIGSADARVAGCDKALKSLEPFVV